MIFLSFNLASAGGGLTEELVFFSITCPVFVTALYFLDLFSILEKALSYSLIIAFETVLSIYLVINSLF